MLHDKDIREPLFEYLEGIYGKIRILEEKNMGSSRADIVMVMENCLCGIEIKSDADSYVRLKSQVEDYDKYFDMNIIVVGTSHALQIHKHVPDYWGIITVEEINGASDFYYLRQPKDNVSMQWDKKMQFLWKPELYEIQRKYGLPKYKDKSKGYIVEKILANVPKKIDESDLKRQMSEILFERDYTKVKQLIKDYRRSEIQKILDTETDSQKRLEEMMRQAENGRILTQRGFKKARSRHGRRR